MTKDKQPNTPAVHFLKRSGVPYILKPYKYVEKGGTEAASRALGVDEHLVVKTLVMEVETGVPVLVLMHGDKQVSTKALARQLGVKRVTPCDPRSANRHTGYQVGGISPFGTRKKIQVLMEGSIGDLPNIYINAGKRGLLAEMDPRDLIKILDPMPVHAAT